MSNSKMVNFKDLKVEHPERYKIISDDSSEVTKTIRFFPGVTYQEGTPENAENFNNIQRNSIYEVAGTRVIEGQNEIYDITIEGSQDFVFENLKICLVPNETNTKKGPMVRLNGNTYTIKNTQDTSKIGSIFTKEKIFLNLNFAQKTAEIIGVLTGGCNLTTQEMKTDSDSIWGGLYGGGKIEDPTVVKEVGKRYIGADGKAYICLVPSNINNSTNYTPCNVVDNLDKIKNFTYEIEIKDVNNQNWVLKRTGNVALLYPVSPVYNIPKLSQGANFITLPFNVKTTFVNVVDPSTDKNFSIVGIDFSGNKGVVGARHQGGILQQVIVLQVL